MPGDPLRIVIAPHRPAAGPPGGREELGLTRATHGRLSILVMPRHVLQILRLLPSSASYDDYLLPRIWRKGGTG